MSVRDVDGLEHLLEQFPLDVEGTAECREIVQGWVARVRQTGDVDRYLPQLWEASNVLEAIRAACWSNWLPPLEKPKQVPRTLWAWPGDSVFVERPKEWLEPSPADFDQLDNAMADYLKRPWMRHDTIDVSVINAFIFTEAALYAEEVKSGRPFGMINWSYLFSGGNPLKQLGFSLLGRLIGFLIAWILLPAISLALLAYGHETAAAVTFCIWALYVLYRLIMIPARFRLRKSRRAAVEKATEILGAMEKAWHAARGRTINPTRLRELVLIAEERGAGFKPVLHTLLDRAVQRDPTAMTRA